jgi:hypothetical protein
MEAKLQDFTFYVELWITSSSSRAFLCLLREQCFLMQIADREEA